MAQLRLALDKGGPSAPNPLNTLSPSPYAFAGQASLGSHGPPTGRHLTGVSSDQATNRRQRSYGNTRRGNISPFADTQVSPTEPSIAGTVQLSHHETLIDGASQGPRPHPQGRLKRRLIQQLRAIGKTNPERDLRLAVCALSANLQKHALDAIFTLALEYSVITAGAVMFLGLKAAALPEGHPMRKSFLSPWGGRIAPKRFTRIVLERLQSGLAPIAENILVLDDNFPDHGFDILLGRRFLHQACGGNLPPKHIANGNGTVNDQNTPFHGTYAHTGWGGVMEPNTNDFPKTASRVPHMFLSPQTSVSGFPVQTWAVNPGWSPQMSCFQNLPGNAYQMPGSRTPYVPAYPGESFIPGPTRPVETGPTLPSPQFEPLLDPNTISGFMPTHWPDVPTNDPDLARDRAG